MNRVALIVLGTAAVLALLAVAGRAESDHAADAQNDGIERIITLVGRNWSAEADSVRLSFTFDCLLYDWGSDPFALEFCFDAQGRVVEAVDRRDVDHPRFWTLRFDPGAATVRVDPVEALATLKRLDPGIGGAAIPLGNNDYGPSSAVPSFARSHDLGKSH